MVRDGADLTGATSPTVTASDPGQYSCRVTATNFAGSSSQVSAPVTVGSSSPPPPDNSFDLGKPTVNKKKGTASIDVTVPGAGELTLSGNGLVPQRAVRPSRLANAKPVVGPSTVTLSVKAKGKAKKKLKKKGKATVEATITFTPTGGTASSQTETVKLKKKRPKRG